MRRTIGMVAAIVAVGMFAGGAYAAAYAEIWDMSSDPTQVGGSMAGAKWTVATGVSAGSGLTLNGDGTIKYTEPGTNSACSFINLGSLGASATIDFRIKVDVGNNSANTGAFAVISASGTRGLNVRNDLIGFDNNPDFTGGTGSLPTGTWGMYRLIMDGNHFTLYQAGENGAAIGAAISDTNGGGSGANGASGATPPYFAIGPSSGGTVTSLEFDLDYLKVAAGNDPAAIYTPEPATMALLAFGVIPMLRRRR